MSARVRIARLDCLHHQIQKLTICGLQSIVHRVCMSKKYNRDYNKNDGQWTKRTVKPGGTEGDSARNQIIPDHLKRVTLPNLNEVFSLAQRDDTANDCGVRQEIRGYQRTKRQERRAKYHEWNFATQR